MKNEATIAGDFDQNILGFQPSHWSCDYQTIVCSIHLDWNILLLRLFLHLLSLLFHLLRLRHNSPSLRHCWTRTHPFLSEKHAFCSSKYLRNVMKKCSTVL